MKSRGKRAWDLNENGITLLEIMIALVIVVIATAMAVPSFTNSTAKSKLKQATTELHGNLNLARMVARNRNMTITTTVGLVGGQVTVTFTDPSTTSANCLADNRQCVMPTLRFPSDVSGAAGTTQVAFNSLGLLSGVGTVTQTMTLTNTNGLSYAIEVTPGGKTRWCATSPCP
ncbi:MAG: GspH/FimT family pseudopilin [Nitrospirales bacterium]